jgi:adenine deaminase
MNEPIEPELRSHAVAAARGLEPFDLLFTGGTVVDVGTGELRPSDVGIVGSLIASVHPRGTREDARQVVDLTDKYLAPGFIDSHVHFESSMLTPAGYAEVVVPRGTTTVFADPHELANVAGVAGIRYAVDASRGLPLRFIFQVPSCVPPVPGLEKSGADFSGADIAKLLEWPEMAGVAEVMDMRGVLDASPRMIEVVEAGIASGKLVEGHAFGLAGADLQGYLAAGIGSDHEIIGAGDAIEKLRSGMTVELRGTFPDVLAPFVEELNKLPTVPQHLVIASDDVFAFALIDEGGVDDVVRRLIASGLDPIQAIRCATLNAAYRLGRGDLGYIGPGRLADAIVLSDLANLVVDDVFASGRHVASGGVMIDPTTAETDSGVLRGTVKLPLLSAQDFTLHLPVPDGVARIKLISGPVMTEWEEGDVTVRDSVVEIPTDLLLQAVVHRHGRGPATPVIGVLSNWGHWTGAIATTISHDTHNLVVFGRDPSDMALAANTVIDSNGGVAVVTGGQVLAAIELPIAGLLSPEPPREVAAKQRALIAAAEEVAELRFPLRYPILQVMVASLACLAGPHVTDLGLADGTTGELVSSLLAS